MVIMCINYLLVGDSAGAGCECAGGGPGRALSALRHMPYTAVPDRSAQRSRGEHQRG